MLSGLIFHGFVRVHWETSFIYTEKEKRDEDLTHSYDKDPIPTETIGEQQHKTPSKRSITPRFQTEFGQSVEVATTV